MCMAPAVSATTPPYTPLPTSTQLWLETSTLTHTRACPATPYVPPVQGQDLKSAGSVRRASMPRGMACVWSHVIIRQVGGLQQFLKGRRKNTTISLVKWIYIFCLFFRMLIVINYWRASEASAT